MSSQRRPSSHSISLQPTIKAESGWSNSNQSSYRDIYSRFAIHIRALQTAYHRHSGNRSQTVWGNLPRWSPCAWVTVWLHPPRCSWAPWAPSEPHNESPKSCWTVTRRWGDLWDSERRFAAIFPCGACKYTQTWRGEHPWLWPAAYLSPGAKRSSPRWCKACHSWTGPSGSVCGLPPPPGPPPCSASRVASTGDRRDCERFGAAAAARAPARADGVGGGRAIVMVMEGRRVGGGRQREREGEVVFDEILFLFL